LKARKSGQSARSNGPQRAALERPSEAEMDESTHAVAALFEEAVAWLHERSGEFEF
jgi:hypothetical protein